MRILILNGPNLNLIGKRQPDVYGKESIVDYLDKLKAQFSDYQISCCQSNHEGILIDKLHEAMDTCDAVIFNPGAYSHTSIALADAIRSIEIPVVEVHISDIYKREDYRRHSYTAEASIKTIVGKGLDGYKEALEFLINDIL